MADSTSTAREHWTELAREQIREVVKTLTDFARSTFAARTYTGGEQLSAILQEQIDRLAAADACLSDDTYAPTDLGALVLTNPADADYFHAGAVLHVADQ